MRKLPRAILFDWDNTLVESWGVIHEAMNLTLDAMGHPRWTPRGDRDACARIAARFVPDHVRRSLEGRGAGLLQQLRSNSPPAPARLARRRPRCWRTWRRPSLYLGVISNKRGEYPAARGRASGLDRSLPRAGRGGRCGARQAGDRACATGARRPGVRRQTSGWSATPTSISNARTMRAACRS